eukprot:Em0869g3a
MSSRVIASAGGMSRLKRFTEASSLYQHSSACFIASICQSGIALGENHHLEQSIDDLNHIVGESEAVCVQDILDVPPRQRNLSSKIEDHQLRMFDLASSPAQCARLLSVSSPTPQLGSQSCPHPSSTYTWSRLNSSLISDLGGLVLAMGAMRVVVVLVPVVGLVQLLRWGVGSALLQLLLAVGAALLLLLAVGAALLLLLAVGAALLLLLAVGAALLLLLAVGAALLLLLAVGAALLTAGSGGSSAATAGGGAALLLLATASDREYRNKVQDLVITFLFSASKVHYLAGVHGILISVPYLLCHYTPTIEVYWNGPKSFCQRGSPRLPLDISRKVRGVRGDVTVTSKAAVIDSKCPFCSSALDPDCHHALTCRSGGDVIARHNKLRDCVANLCSKACLSPQLEKGPGIDFSRPADVLVPNWSLSNPAAFDLKVIHPLNTDLILEASLASGNSAEVGEIEKHAKNDQMCARLGWTCIPLVVEVYGGWGCEAKECYSRLSKRLAMQVGICEAEALCQMYCLLAVTLMRQNARAILLRCARAPLLEYSH